MAEEWSSIREKIRCYIYLKAKGQEGRGLGVVIQNVQKQPPDQHIHKLGKLYYGLKLLARQWIYTSILCSRSDITLEREHVMYR